MLALLGLFIIVLISFIVIRVSAVALEVTGLSQEVATFQAISAFSGAGFTTSESESILTHPARRRIVQTLIIFGSAGITTAIASLILTFVGQKFSNALIHFGLLTIGLIIVILIIRSNFVQKGLRAVILNIINKFNSIQIYDYYEVLGLGKGFVISKVVIDNDSWMLNKALKDLKLDREGTLVLSLEKFKDNKRVFYGAPNGKTILELDDIVTCYGKPEAIKNLAERTRDDGDVYHQEQCEKLKKEEVSQ